MVQQQPRPITHRASKCFKKDCPGHRWAPGGCPDPVGHGLRCSACGSYEAELQTVVDDYDQLNEAQVQELIFRISYCLACGGEFIVGDIEHGRIIEVA